MANEINPFQKLQSEYWTYDAAEQRSLAARGEALSWKELLRLHHLNCLELLQSDAGRKAFQSEKPVKGQTPTKASQPLMQSHGRLISPESPYRPHGCVVWRRNGPPDVQREPDQMGLAINASLTHLGAIEVIRQETDGNQLAVDFVGISEVRSVVFGPPAIFGGARISFDDTRAPIVVRLPLLYGVSWQSQRPYDRDGSLTRFCCHQAMGEFGTFGMGVGHQDLLLRGGDGTEGLIGLGSLQEIQTPLDMRDPTFDTRCRARGIDPEQVRRQHPPAPGA